MTNFNVKLKDKDNNYLFPYTRVDQVEGVENINVYSSTKLQTGKDIDGVNFDGTTSISHYALCTTSSSTSEKAVIIENFNIKEGSRVEIKFQNGNTATNPTLNINGLGAYPIHCQGSNVSSSLIVPNYPYTLLFTGTSWDITGGIPLNSRVMTITYW